MLAFQRNSKLFAYQALLLVGILSDIFKCKKFDTGCEYGIPEVTPLEEKNCQKSQIVDDLDSTDQRYCSAATFVLVPKSSRIRLNLD